MQTSTIGTRELRNKKSPKLWFVVTVERGFPSTLMVFRSRNAAVRAENAFRKKMHPDYDESGLFALDANSLTLRSGVSVEAEP